MVSSRFIGLFVLLAIAAQDANALSTDDKTMNNGNAERYSDPDERTPQVNMTPEYSSANLQNKESSRSGSEDPSTVRYEYDKDSGTFVPHKQ